MPRYEHYLSSLRQSAQPAVIIGLALETRPVKSEVSANEFNLELVRWHASVRIRERYLYSSGSIACSRSVEGFWKSLSNHSRGRRDVFIVSYKCGEVWPLIGLYEGLESGGITLGVNHGMAQQDHAKVSWVRKVHDTNRHDGFKRSCRNTLPDVPSSNHNRRKLPPNRGKCIASLAAGGFIVVEDPPNIIQFRIPGLATKFTWVDIRNYGQDIFPGACVGPSGAKSLAELLVSWAERLASNSWGALRTTGASQALSVFRTGFLRDAIHCHNTKSALDLEERSYVGGRCEAFRIGRIYGRVYHLDVRSMYPSLYIGEEIPIRLVKVEKNFTGSPQLLRGIAGEIIADVLLTSDEPAYPVKRDGIVIYPVGTFRTTLCGPELVDALDRSRVIKVSQYAHYEFGRPFWDYGRQLYGLRQDGEFRADYAQSAIAKVLLNGIVGKMGQREKRWINRPNRQADKPYGYWYEPGPNGELTRWRSIAWNVQSEFLGQWANDAVPAVASWITSLGRLKLLSYMRIVGITGVYYVDTDALIVSETGFKRLKDSNLVQDSHLGYLRLLTMNDDCEIFGIKHYRIGEETKHAGLPRNVTRIDNTRPIYSVTASTIRDIMAGKHPTTGVKTVVFNHRPEYKHGVVRPNGTVSPININEGEEIARAS